MTKERQCHIHVSNRINYWGIAYRFEMEGSKKIVQPPLALKIKIITSCECWDIYMPYISLQDRPELWADLNK